MLAKFYILIASILNYVYYLLSLKYAIGYLLLTNFI